MAVNIPVYGLDRELEEKKNARYDPNREQEVRGWIETVIGEKLSAGSFPDALNDGLVLCKCVVILGCLRRFLTQVDSSNKCMVPTSSQTTVKCRSRRYLACF